MGLKVRDLNVTYRIAGGAIRAVDSVSFDVAPGERLGLVGESGSGKTTTALALMQMLREPGRCDGGTAVIDGTDLLAISPAAMREQRLRAISYIPQGAMNSLNPVHTVERQMRSVMLDHGVASPRAELQRRCVTALAGVGLDAEVLRRYPHELSGGMKQRVCVAIGMLLGPKVIIADEPTSALDVISQRAGHGDPRPRAAAQQRGAGTDWPRHRIDGAVRPSACGHVRRPSGGDRQHPGGSDASPPPIHPRADRQHPKAARPRQAWRHSGRHAVAASVATRLRVPSPLCLSLRALPARQAATR